MDPQEHWAACGAYGVNAVFPADLQGEEATWPQCQRYLEQVQVCWLCVLSGE